MRKEIQQAGDLNDRYTEAHSKLEDFGVQQSYNFERIAKEWYGTSLTQERRTDRDRHS